MASTRRGVIQTLAAPLFLTGLDEDGDGKYLDDILGLEEDRAAKPVPVFFAEDAEDAERIDPIDYPVLVVVKSGRLQGVHPLTENGGEVDG